MVKKFPEHTQKLLETSSKLGKIVVDTLKGNAGNRRGGSLSPRARSGDIFQNELKPTVGKLFSKFFLLHDP